MGSTPHEFFEDYVRQEKDLLKHHKSSFKQLVKHNCIRLGSDVAFENFKAALERHEWYLEQPDNIKVLLYEYYVYKIKHKEQERESKMVKAIAEFLRKSLAKLCKDTQLDHVNAMIDERPDFSSARPELR